MYDDILDYLLKGIAAINAGPDGREILRTQMEQQYNKGNVQHSVFYQVMMLLQVFDLRFACEAEADEVEPQSVQQFCNNMNEWERQDFKSNPLMQYAYQQLSASETASALPKRRSGASKLRTTNFLHDVRTPAEGLRRIEMVCQQMPSEWTIIQLCKGPRSDTTYSIYPKIHVSSAPIYLTLLHHARSAEYPQPICLRFSTCVQREENLFQKFANIAESFKRDISVSPDQVHSPEFKIKYWQNLNNLETYISNVLCEFKSFFFPWLFLFTGIPVDREMSCANTVFGVVDLFCNSHKWSTKERVLLSLAALHVKSLCKADLEAVCLELAPNEGDKEDAFMLLQGLQATGKSSAVLDKTAIEKHYPCILIVDERLDHFYWEELNVNQEFSRVGSLQCLWRLQQFNKHRIHNGYLKLNVESGGCIINPDNTLANTEMRMSSFLKYWLPHWHIKCRQKVFTDEFFKDFFSMDCFVYAGHGSGLQYFSSKQLTQQQINGVVFLFGCDSTRLRSNGLYSELIGAHRYYHAALCPAVVGTLLPGLDCNMDSIAAQVLSHWLGPTSTTVMPWTEVQPRPWAKEGVIKAKVKTKTCTVADTPDYLVGSLCEVLARVHQRCYDKNYYNTIGYVCRGLPVWNCGVQPLAK